MFLNPKMHELLLTLDRAALNGGDGWVSANALGGIPSHIRNYAYTKGYVTGRGKTSARQYKITAQGRTMLAKNAEANLAVMDKLETGYVPTGDEADVPQTEFKGFEGLFEIKPGPRPESNGNGIIKSLNTAASIPFAKQKNSQAAVVPLDAHTRACVQAIGILSEDWPEVKDLVAALMKLNARKDRHLE